MVHVDYRPVMCATKLRGKILTCHDMTMHLSMELLLFLMRTHFTFGYQFQLPAFLLVSPTSPVAGLLHRAVQALETARAMQNVRHGFMSPPLQPVAMASRMATRLALTVVGLTAKRVNLAQMVCRMATRQEPTVVVPAPPVPRHLPETHASLLDLIR